MRLRVRQVQGAAEGVAELVVQRHGGGAEHRAAQPGAVLGLGRGVQVGAVGDDRGAVRATSARTPSSAISEMIGVASGA